jgi:hypothetical protein
MLLQITHLILILLDRAYRIYASHTYLAHILVGGIYQDMPASLIEPYHTLIQAIACKHALLEGYVLGILI